jgi:hypothetical protein
MVSLEFQGYKHGEIAEAFQTGTKRITRTGPYLFRLDEMRLHVKASKPWPEKTRYY